VRSSVSTQTKKCGIGGQFTTAHAWRYWLVISDTFFLQAEDAFWGCVFIAIHQDT